MQQATFFNMPLAIGFGRSWSNYLEIAKTYPVLAYWWTPDVSLIEMDMHALMLPPHNPDLAHAGLFVTAQDIQFEGFAHAANSNSGAFSRLAARTTNPQQQFKNSSTNLW